MRVSGIENYIQGADNVNATSIIRGEQRVFAFTIHDNTAAQNPLDITDFTITGVAEFYNATATISGTGDRQSASVTGFDPHPTLTDVDLSANITILDAANGVVQFVLPSTLVAAGEEGAIDTETVLTAVVYLEYNDGGTPAVIRKSRLVVFIRHAG